MDLHGNNFIGDQLSSGTGKGLAAISPVDSSTLPGSFYSATARDADMAAEAGEAAFQTYSKTSGEQRAAFLEGIAQEIIALGDALIARAHLETGLPEARLTGERARTIGQLRLFAQVAREGSWVD